MAAKSMFSIESEAKSARALLAASHKAVRLADVKETNSRIKYDSVLLLLRDDILLCSSLRFIGFYYRTLIDY